MVSSEERIRSLYSNNIIILIRDDGKMNEAFEKMELMQNLGCDFGYGYPRIFYLGISNIMVSRLYDIVRVIWDCRYWLYFSWV